MTSYPLADWGFPEVSLLLKKTLYITVTKRRYGFYVVANTAFTLESCDLDVLIEQELV